MPPSSFDAQTTAISLKHCVPSSGSPHESCGASLLLLRVPAQSVLLFRVVFLQWLVWPPLVGVLRPAAVHGLDTPFLAGAPLLPSSCQLDVWLLLVDAKDGLPPFTTL